MSRVAHSLRFLLSAALALTTTLGSAAAQNTYLLLNSQPGDSIGQGTTKRFSEADATFTVMDPFGNEVAIWISSPTASWFLQFAAPGGVPLSVGSYEGARRFEWVTPFPGLSVTGEGRGCNTLTGRFDVLEVEYGPTGLVRFAANAEQHCDSATGALFVAIRFGATPRPAFSVTVSPTGVAGGAIASRPAGIDCGAQCGAVFDDGIPVLLSATAPAGTVVRWGGSPDCADGVVSGGASVACTAEFQACAFALDPAEARLPPLGGYGSFNAAASDPQCTWTPTSSASWLRVVGGARQGSAQVQYYVDPLPPGAARVATIAVANAVFTAIQRPPVPPGPPLDLAVAVNGGVGHFSWHAPDLGGEATAYVLEAGFWPYETDVTIPVPDARTTLDIAGVPPGVFYLRVRGVNQYGVGAPSDEYELVVVDGVSPPGEPRQLQASLTGARVQASWLPPVDGGPVTSYRLEAGSSYLDADIADVDVGAVPAFTYDGIPPGNYFVRVRATNAAGAGEPTDDVLLRVGGLPGPPDPPQALAVAVAGSTVSFSWLPPPGPDATLAYLLVAGSRSRLDDIAGAFIGGSARAVAFGGVPSGTYYVRLWALNEEGFGLPSNEVVVVVP